MDIKNTHVLNIPIVISAFNREHSLRRLLNSLLKAHYPEQQKLIISIDGGGAKEVIELARSVEWPFGEKEIIVHETNLGLRKHILCCGSLSQHYDGILLLEDDLFVSPYFYEYASKTAHFYKECDKICGIALYPHRYNETACFPFQPLDDGSDTFFMQLACSSGQLWLKKHWAEFSHWYHKNKTLDLSKDLELPIDITKYWPNTSWKKFFTKFMLECDKFFVYPQHGYSTNFGDVGQHCLKSTLFQVPLVFEKNSYNFKEITQSYLQYDSFCEMLPESIKKLCPQLQKYDFVVDLYGVKSIHNFSAEFVLTSKKSKRSAMSFGRELTPHENNVIQNIDGDLFSLSKTEDIHQYYDINGYRFDRAQDIAEQLYHYSMDELHYGTFFKERDFLKKSLAHIQTELEQADKMQKKILHSNSFRVVSMITQPFHLIKDWWSKKTL